MVVIAAVVVSVVIAVIVAIAAAVAVSVVVIVVVVAVVVVVVVVVVIAVVVVVVAIVVVVAVAVVVSSSSNSSSSSSSSSSGGSGSVSSSSGSRRSSSGSRRSGRFLWLSSDISLFTASYTSKQNIVEVAKSLGLSTLVQLVTAANLGGALIRQSATYTVFSPSNEAFAKVPKDTLDKLLKDRKALANLLLFHVASGRVPAQSLKSNQRIATLNSPNTLLVNIAEEPKVNNIQHDTRRRLVQLSSCQASPVSVRLLLGSLGTIGFRDVTEMNGRE